MFSFCVYQILYNFRFDFNYLVSKYSFRFFVQFFNFSFDYNYFGIIILRIPFLMIIIKIWNRMLGLCNDVLYISQFGGIYILCNTFCDFKTSTTTWFQKQSKENLRRVRFNEMEIVYIRIINELLYILKQFHYVPEMGGLNIQCQTFQ